MRRSPEFLIKGAGNKHWWYKLREAAPERPEQRDVAQERMRPYEKPKIEPVAGRAYWVTPLSRPFSELARFKALLGFCQFHKTGLWFDVRNSDGTQLYNTVDHFEILAEIPTPEEYIEKMGGEK